MTPAPHPVPSLDEALAEALEQLTAGLTPLQILELFPQYEGELGPLLDTAYRLRTTRWPALSMAARVAGRERMHAAFAGQKGRRRFVLAPIWRQLAAGLALVLLAGTTYIASPVSPLRSLNRPRLTATVPLVATATWTPASATTQPSATTEPPLTVAAFATPIPAATIKIREISEPTETVDPEMGLKHSQPSVSPTLYQSATPPPATRTRVPTSTPTSTPTHTPTLTPTPTATATPTATDAVLSGAAVPAGPVTAVTPIPSTEVPSPTTTPAATDTPAPEPTLVTKTMTPVLKPTDEPEPVVSPTSPPPEKTVPPSQTPELDHALTPQVPVPIATVHTPEAAQGRHLAHTPAPAKTTGAVDGKPGGTIQTLVEQARKEGTPPGQAIRAAVRDARRSPRGEANRP